MKNLIRKEFLIGLHPATFIFMLFAPMLLIPSYPYILAFFYVFFCFTFVFPMSNENKDTFYSAILPTRKKDIVNSRIFTTLFLELGSTIIAIPFAFISRSLYPSGNPVGLDANMSLFAVALIGYAVFNIIFLPWFYKTANKFLIPFFVSLIISTIIIAVLSAIIVYASTTFATLFDGYSLDTIWFRLGALCFGIILLFLSTIFTSKLAIKNFNKVDL